MADRQQPEGRTPVERRARMHAALGEPVRLFIVDQLVLGDASPGELRALVELPTNLLAHHLNVLDNAGLIRRVRSEGDRRRSYVQLALDDPAVAALVRADPPTPPAADRVVFVCTRNSARSQFAAAAWAQASAVPAASAGTHPAARIHPRAVRVGRRHGLRLAASRTSHVDDVVRDGDLVVAVCDNAHEELPAARCPPTSPGCTGRYPIPPQPTPTTPSNPPTTRSHERVERLAYAFHPLEDSARQGATP